MCNYSGDIKIGVDVSPLFCSTMLLDRVMTSPSTFLICGWKRCLLNFLVLDPNICLFNLFSSNLVANSTSLKIHLCVVEHPFWLMSTMPFSFDVLVQCSYDVLHET